MTDTIEAKDRNMEKPVWRLLPEETERSGGEIVAALKPCSIRKFRLTSTSSA
jgi:hypothetical protein